MSVCEVCKKGPDDDVTIFRQNEPGEMPAIWRCREHRYVKLDEETEKLIKVLEDGVN